MTATHAPEIMPEMIVDRSPELKRGASSAPGWGATGTTSVTMKAEGDRGDGGRCALARVILATWPDVIEAHVEGEHPYVVFAGGTKVPFFMGPDVAEWIGRFDRGENPEPVEVHLTR